MKHLNKNTCFIVFIFLLSACVSTNKKNTTDAKQLDFVPKLKRPEVRKVWVPDQIVGDEYITGHWKFVLEKNAVWTKEN